MRTRRVPGWQRAGMGLSSVRPAPPGWLVGPNVAVVANCVPVQSIESVCQGRAGGARTRPPSHADIVKRHSSHIDQRGRGRHVDVLDSCWLHSNRR